MEELSKYILTVVSEDEMSVDLYLSEAGDSEIYDVDKIIEYISQKDKIVPYLIKASAIEDMIKHEKYGEMVTVAKGRPARDGEDGYFVFNFETNPSKKPKLLEDGSVDYRNLNLVQSVAEGDLLAVYQPKEEGQDGETVRGKPILAARCKDLPPLRGQGFRIDEDGRSYYATRDGKITRSMGMLNVTTFYTIPGDVDLSIGNIDFKGDIEILGSIKQGFSVKATGNITVNGLIEGAYVESGKDILVKGGILGGGKAEIVAGGCLFASFVENAKVTVHNSIQADSIVNCDVTAYSDVNIFGKASTIVGGKVKANRTIRAHKIGSETGTMTELMVGIEPDVMHTYNVRLKELGELEDRLNKVEKTIELMSDKTDKDDNLMMQLIRTKIELSAQVYKEKSICEELHNRIEIGKHATVVAESIVYPGTIVKIDGQVLHVEEEFKWIMFLRKGDKILTQRVID